MIFIVKLKSKQIKSGKNRETENRGIRGIEEHIKKEEEEEEEEEERKKKRGPNRIGRRRLRSEKKT